MPDVPGPPGHHLHGNEQAFRADPRGFLLEMARRYGDLVRFRLGFRACFLVSDPVEIQRILAHPTAFADKQPGERHRHAYVRSVARTSGPEHRERRRLLQPAFHSVRLRAGVAVTARTAERVLADLPDTPMLPLMPVLKRIVARSMAVQLLGAAATPHLEALEASLATIEAWLGGAGDVEKTQLEDAHSRLEVLVLSLAGQHPAREGAEPVNLLAQLLRRTTSAGAEPASEEAVLVDEIAMMLMTNLPVVQTAARAASYLASLPALDRRLDQELGGWTDGAPIGEEALAGALLLDGLVRETLRLHPPVWTLAREARVDWPVGAHTIPAGSEVLVSPYVVQCHPRHWKQPEAFLPERFGPSTSRACERPRLAWFPFGAGQRKCLGERMSLLLVKVVLAMLRRRYRFALSPGHPSAGSPLTTAGTVMLRQRS